MLRTRIFAAALLLALCIPLISSAAPSNTSGQATIAELQAQVQALMAQVASLQKAQQGTSSPTTSTPTTCPLTRTLLLRMKGSHVTCLQSFLIAQGHLAQGNSTGYFGLLTETAVKSFQRQKGIVSSGSPSTTGYGAVGPKTRAAILAAYKTVQTPPAITPPTNSGGGGGGGSGGNGGVVGDGVSPVSPPGTPVLSPDHGNGLTVAIGTLITITSTNASSIRYTMNNTNPTCTSGTLYSDSAKPVITTTNTTLKAIGCNSGGASVVTPRWYFTSTPHSTLFDYAAIRNGVGQDANDFVLNAYTVPLPNILPAPGNLYARSKAEFEQAIATVKDGETIWVASGEYDLGLQEIKRTTSAAAVTIRAERPNICYSVPGTGVTLTGSTKLRFWTDGWRLEGFCFENISNKGSESYSKVIQISASNVTISQNKFKNLGSASNWMITIMVGGDTNLASERKYLENIVITRNIFSNIVGIGVDFEQPAATYSGPYVWALRPEISYNTFENSPLVLENGGEAIHLGIAWDFSDSFSDTMGARVTKNFFNNWDGDGELMSVKSTGNFIEDNLIYESLGSISIRAGDHNTIQRNYIINSSPSCHGFRVSGTGNIFANNFLDLHPNCIAWIWTAKHFDTAPYADGSYTVATYPAKTNYFRFNKVKNAQNIIWVYGMGSNHKWEHNPPSESDLPTNNTLRLNEFYNMKDATLFFSDLPPSVVSESSLIPLNILGTDNQYIN